MSSCWMVLTSDEEKGPFTLEELQSLVLRDELTANTLVRGVESHDPILAGNLSGLFSPSPGGAQASTGGLSPNTDLALSRAVVSIACLLALHFVLPQLSFVEKLLTLGLGAACACYIVSSRIDPSKRSVNGTPAMIYGGAFLIGILMWPGSLDAHPVFNTPLTATTSSRPAVLVTITDEGEGLGPAELYMAVHSSRFPANTLVLLPINRGDFAGCTKRFIALPFEVVGGDILVFELLDEDGLTTAQESLIIEACRATGYCVAVAATIYQPEASHLVNPLTDNVSQVLGIGIVEGLRSSTFQSFGTAEYIVREDRPVAPNLANRLTLLDANSYSHGSLQVYFPGDPSEISHDETF